MASRYPTENSGKNQIKEEKTENGQKTEAGTHPFDLDNILNMSDPTPRPAMDPTHLNYYHQMDQAECLRTCERGLHPHFYRKPGHADQRPYVYYFLDPVATQEEIYLWERKKECDILGILKQ